MKAFELVVARLIRGRWGRIARDCVHDGYLDGRMLWSEVIHTSRDHVVEGAGKLGLPSNLVCECVRDSRLALPDPDSPTVHTSFRASTMAGARTD